MDVLRGRNPFCRRSLRMAARDLMAQGEALRIHPLSTRLDYVERSEFHDTRSLYGASRGCCAESARFHILSSKQHRESTGGGRLITA